MYGFFCLLFLFSFSFLVCVIVYVYVCRVYYEGEDSLMWKRKHFAWITLLKGSNTESLVITSYNFGLKILDSFGFFFSIPMNSFIIFSSEVKCSLWNLNTKFLVPSAFQQHYWWQCLLMKLFNFLEMWMWCRLFVKTHSFARDFQWMVSFFVSFWK